MKLTVATVKTLIDLEKKYQLLSGDRLGQDELFEMQDELTKEMVECASNNQALIKTLSKELPYLFQTQKV